LGLIRLRAGEWLAGAGGVALIVSLLLLPWYAGTETLTGFEALTVIDILLALLALLGIALAVFQATQDDPSRPVGTAVLGVVLGFLGVLLVLFRLIDAPADGLEVRYGAWVALAGTLAITVGSWRSLAAEYVRGLPPDLEPELRPTPAP
jgi:amino acid transporter